MTQHLDGSGTVKQAKGTHPAVGACRLRLVEHSTSKDSYAVVLHYTDAKGYEQTSKAGQGSRVEAEAAFDRLASQMAGVTVEAA